MLIVHIYFNNPFRSEINDVLAWISASVVENYFFVWIVLGVLSKEIFIFDAVPYNRNCGKVLSCYFVGHINKPNVNGSIDWSSSGHGFTWVQCLGRLDVEDVRNNFLNHRDTRTTTNELNINILNTFWVHLNFGFNSAFYIIQSCCHLAQNRHDNIFEFFSFHIVIKVLFVHNVLNVQMMFDIGTKHFSLFFDHIFQFDQCFRISDYLVLLGLLVEKVIVELGQIIIHVFRPCIFQVFVIQ